MDAKNRRQERLGAAFFDNEVTSMRIGGQMRAVVTAIVAVWVGIENSDWVLRLWYPGWILMFGAIGLFQSFLAQTGRYRAWMKYAFIAFDAVLFAVLIVTPPPFQENLFPRPLLLNHGIVVYAFILLLSAAFQYSPRYALWSGSVLAIAWAGAYGWVSLLPDTLLGIHSIAPAPTFEAAMLAEAHPYRLHLGHMYRDVVVFLVCAGVIAATARRARQMVAAQADVEYQRASLARYFSPNLVDELSASDDDLEGERRQPVAVLFADIVGFTMLCENAGPEQVMRLLRQFQQRMEAAIFEHGGTLDKYLGDGVMATFGTPRAGERDAGNALACALAMQRSMVDWNAERRRAGETEIAIGVGIDFGPCVVGDVGAERLEFTVVGDTVNVAARLEEATRALATGIVISEDLAKAVTAAGNHGLLAQFSAPRPFTLRGREGEVVIRSCDREDIAALEAQAAS
ncbi:MAG: adenylate/guanylate cyclase domain-containing protein [Alphaproteobacteria bacterium]|jgi:adenylate cyclase|nr:adenylate/guanylate cyclase domain-containing protein [Alphaproteobacteria bacterium]MDP6565094.1 adenylate/guanylate cyclase domain-containing protein [Alphaproteobacteria bacterium]